MSSLRWTGTALPVRDVWKLVLGGTWATNDTITLTINTRALVLTVGATVTTASIATALKEMWNGSTISGDATRSNTGNNVPEFAESTASIGATTSTTLFTMNTAGVPMTVSRTISSASGTATLTNSTVATGPNFWSDINNWDTGAIPANGDTVYIDNASVDILYGLAQSGVAPAAVYIAQSFTATIGLPEVNAAGGYHEYRATYLALAPVILQIGSGPGQGSGRIKINCGSSACALTVYNSGAALDQVPAILWKGTSASNTLTMIGGNLGVAIFGPEVATLSTVTKSGGDLVTSSGVTLSGALTQAGGTWLGASAIATSFTQIGGLAQFDGTGAVAQLTLRGGTFNYSTTGTLGGATVVSGTSLLDFSLNSVATTISAAIDIYGTAAFVNDHNKRLGSVVVDFNEGALATQVDFGLNYRLSRGATA